MKAITRRDKRYKVGSGAAIVDYPDRAFAWDCLAADLIKMGGIDSPDSETYSTPFTTVIRAS